jgi:hypothetical protein
MVSAYRHDDYAFAVYLWGKGAKVEWPVRDVPKECRQVNTEDKRGDDRTTNNVNPSLGLYVPIPDRHTQIDTISNKLKGDTPKDTFRAGVTLIFTSPVTPLLQNRGVCVNGSCPDRWYQSPSFKCDCRRFKVSRDDRTPS